MNGPDICYERVNSLGNWNGNCGKEGSKYKPCAETLVWARAVVYDHFNCDNFCFLKIFFQGCFVRKIDLHGGREPT